MFPVQFNHECCGFGCSMFKVQFFAASDKDVINFCILNLYPAILLILVFFKEDLGFL